MITIIFSVYIVSIVIELLAIAIIYSIPQLYNNPIEFPQGIEKQFKKAFIPIINTLDVIIFVAFLLMLLIGFIIVKFKELVKRSENVRH